MRLVELRGENGRIRFHPRLTLVTLDEDTGESFARRLSNALTSPGGEHLVIEIDGTLTDASQLPRQLLELGETLILGEADLLRALVSIGTDLESKAFEQRTELVESLAVLRERVSREISQRDALVASIADVNRRVEDLREVLARCDARGDQAPLSALDPETLRRARAADRDQLESELAALAETLEAEKEALDEAVRSGHYVSALDAAELARIGSAIKLFEREVESNDDPELLAVLEAKQEAERALLESLGFESKMDYLLYVTTHSADPDVESRRADARRRFEDAWRAHDELREFCELVERLGALGLLVQGVDDELPSVEEVHRDLDSCEAQKADLGLEVKAHNERLAKLDHLCAGVEAKLQRLASELTLWENPSLENLRSEHVEMVLRAALEVHPWIEELGPLPILIEDAFTQLNADVRREMLDLVAELSEDVQIVIVSNNAAVVAMVRRQGKQATTIAPKLRRPGPVVAKRWPNAPGADAPQVEDLKGVALASTTSTGPSARRSASRIGSHKRLGRGNESAQRSEAESTENLLDANPTAAAPIVVSEDLQRQALEVAQEALGKARRAAEARRSADSEARGSQAEEKRTGAEEARRRRDEEKRRREEDKRKREEYKRMRAESKRAALAAQREEVAAKRRRIAEQRAVSVVNSQAQRRRPTQTRGAHPDPLRRGAPPDQRVATGREQAVREKALREQAVREEALRQRVEREELDRERKRQEKIDKAERSAAQREARAAGKRLGDETARVEQARRDEALRLAREEEARLERRARAQAAAAAARLAVQTAAAEAAAREAAEAAVLAGQAAKPRAIQPDVSTPADNIEPSPLAQRLGSTQRDQDGEVRPSWERMTPEPVGRERCRSHSFTGAVGHCSQCELPFCDECLVELGRKESQLTCVNCALVLAGVRRRGKNRG